MTTDAVGNASNDVSNQLRRAFFQAREFNAKIYIHVVLDPNHPVAPFDSLHPDHLKERVPSVKSHRSMRTDFQHQPALCPIVVTLFSPGDRGYRDEELLQETADNAVSRCTSVNGSYVCGWIATTLSGEDFAKKIAMSTVITHPLSGRKVLPWFEPHRLALLVDRHPSFALSRLTNISSWWFVDMAKQLRVVSPPEGIRNDIVDPPRSLLPLSGRQISAVWDGQERIREGRLVGMAMRKAGLPLPAFPELAMDKAVGQAHECGLHGEQDVVFFAMNSLTLSKDWFQHPVVQAALETLAGSDDLTLADILAGQSDAVLDEIALYETTGSAPR
ncbi:hypothetical protein VSR17_22855 [Cupriavidus taiwanensis]|uniref:DUF4123 domain-containing protein n=1 Tax=Cupriavidus taiwanensis TaxID=164546 RepID=A0A375IPE2_9BURK|nr:hypothetical protein [Cupriavidus taiwanensis]SPA35897.1 conserved hypothetical protein [Cupriavidus taiwanensis]SPK75125.1 conserved protein of unknown function [Cupriavidus taiwanensis]